jgi:branched-chain amino acid transport system substrate-binding protein
MRQAIVRLPRMRLLFAALIAIAITGGVAAASSGAAPAARAAASKSTWVIGNIGTYSGINSGNFLGGGQALQAWADWTNANGGIDGHHVKVISLDDAGVASTSVNDVKQLVQSDHVLAIVAMNSGDDADWATYIQGTGVPVIGGSTPLPDFAGYSDYFPVGATTNNSIPDLLLYAKNVLNQTVGGYLGCEEAPVCSALEPVYAAAYKGIGGNLAYNTLFSSSAPSYAAQCLAAQSAGVQDLEIIGPAPVIPKIAQNCQTQGYNPTLLLNDVVLTPSLGSSIGTADAVFGADDVPFTDDGIPATKAFHAAVAKYEPSVLNPADFNQDDLDSWASGQLFAAAAKAAKLGNKPTSKQLVAGLYKLKGVTLGGLTPPLTFNKGKPNSVSCIYIMSIFHGSIIEPQGLKRYCPATG